MARKKSLTKGRKKFGPTPDPQSNVQVPTTLGYVRPKSDEDILTALQSYKAEADQNRKGGMNPRDDKWSTNLDLYWGRYDFSKKAAWQAQEAMPEVSSYVDRFAAAMKEALVSTPNGFYTVSDPSDQDNKLGSAIKRMTDVWLTQVGRNQVGQLMDFSAHFEEEMKMGALMAVTSVTTWKNDVPGGRVATEVIDPRDFWMDHTYRNLYRIRKIEIDRHEFIKMAKSVDGKGKPIYNLNEVENLMSGMMLEDQRIREEAAGSGAMIVSGRQPVVLDEYIATVVGSTGELLADRSLMVVANGSHLIRGPEANPFWHGRDWINFTPLVTAPLSPYGRSYMEDFGGVAKTFNELTNMILDAVHTSSLNMYAMVPGMLMNPAQVAEGLSPNKLFLLEDGMDVRQFATKLEMGALSSDALQVWNSLKSELSEAAGINEIGLGQFAPNSRTSATEVSATQQSSSALIRSVAQTVETRYLDPQLDLIWKTGMQHVTRDNKMIVQAAGEDMFNAMMARRREFVARPFTFQARGISQLIGQAQKKQALISVLGVIASNDILLQTFLQEVDVVKLVNYLLEMSGIDMSKLTLSDREKAIRQIAAPMQQMGAGQGQPQGGANPVGSMVAAMGIGRRQQ